MYNIIKSERIQNGNEKEIETKFEVPKVDPYREFKENSARTYIDSYENLARTMLENSRRQADEILGKAYDEVRNMEEESKNQQEIAMKKAEEDGYKEGYNKGYKESSDKFEVESKKAMEQIIEDANKRKDEIIGEAVSTLNSAKEEYDKYIEEKHQFIKEVILNFAEKILKREVENEDSLNALVLDLLSQSKKSKVFVIRCNERYVEELTGKIEEFKQQLAYMGDIFVIKDNSIELGNVVIEKSNGKVKAGIDIGLEEFKHIIGGID